MSPRKPSLVLVLLVITMSAAWNGGCLDRDTRTDGEYEPIGIPETFDLAVVDGTGQRDAQGLWYYQGPIHSWALFIQEVYSPSRDDFRAMFEVSFVPERALSRDEVVLLGNPQIRVVNEFAYLNLDFVWSEVAVGKGSLVEHQGPVHVESAAKFAIGDQGALEPQPAESSTGRSFVAFYAMTSVPGELRLAIDFGANGAAEWEPTLFGSDEVQTTGATMHSGDPPVVLEVPILANSTAILFIEEDNWRTPAWRNITIGRSKPYMMKLEGSRLTETQARNFVSAYGWISIPERTVRATAEYDGPDEPHRAVLATAETDIAGALWDRYQIRLRSILAGRGYDAPF